MQHFSLKKLEVSYGKCWSFCPGPNISYFCLNTLRPSQNGRLITDNTFTRIFLNENNRIFIKISLKFVPKGLINNISALVLIMAWRWPGDKPLSGPMMVRSLTHICITRPQWVNSWRAANAWVCTQHCGCWCCGAETSGGRFKNPYELLNLRAFKISMLYKNHIFQWMGKLFCVEFQRVPLKFHTKYLAHTLKDVNFIHRWKFNSS